MRRLSLLFLLVVSAAQADTVTGRDSSSWNGSVTISEGVLHLVAYFRTGKVTLTFGANYVRSIQFNPTVYNPGSNPVSLLPKQTLVELFRGTIYMQNPTSQKSCDKSITVDRVPSDSSRATVSCDGDKPIPNVIRILMK